MREEIVSFVRDTRENEPLFIEMVGISYCDGGYRIERRNSGIYVVEYILQGRGTVESDGVRFHPQAGDVYLLHRGSNHWYASDGQDPWVKIWCNMGGPLAEGLVASYGLGGVLHVPAFGDPGCFERLYQAALRHRADRPALHSEAALLLHELMIQLSARLRHTADAGQTEAERLRAFLDGKLHEKIAMEDIGRQIFRSPSQATRLFRQAYGVTPYRYLIDRRIETAKLLLLNSNLSVREIAHELCFADEHYFSNRFKMSTGRSPRQFRNRS